MVRDPQSGLESPIKGQREAQVESIAHSEAKKDLDARQYRGANMGREPT